MYQSVTLKSPSTATHHQKLLRDFQATQEGVKIGVTWHPPPPSPTKIFNLSSKHPRRLNFDNSAYVNQTKSEENKIEPPPPFKGDEEEEDFPCIDHIPLTEGQWGKAENYPL